MKKRYKKCNIVEIQFLDHQANREYHVNILIIYLFINNKILIISISSVLCIYTDDFTTFYVIINREILSIFIHENDINKFPALIKILCIF